MTNTLTDQQAADAVQEYKMRGWLGAMASQVDDAQGDRTYLGSADPLSIFNIRFLPENGERYPNLRVASPQDVIQKRPRYTLALAGAIVRDLLIRAGGATLQEIVDATGWQKHTVPAFISTLLEAKHTRGFPARACVYSQVKRRNEEPRGNPTFGRLTGMRGGAIRRTSQHGVPPGQG